MKTISVLVMALVLAACQSSPQNLGQCPQPRFTGKAPAEFLGMHNPYQEDRGTLSQGKELYQHSVSETRIACARCHGSDGDGVGALSHMFDPPPRNFTCAQTIKGVADGQLFWIIRNGSPDTSMPAFDELNDEQIWSLILYIRKLSERQYGS